MSDNVTIGTEYLSWTTCIKYLSTITYISTAQSFYSIVKSSWYNHKLVARIVWIILNITEQ